MGGTIKSMLARSYPQGLPLAAVQRYGRQLTLTLALTLTLTLTLALALTLSLTRYGRQLLSGLHFLHEAMVIHSDLKVDPNPHPHPHPKPKPKPNLHLHPNPNPNPNPIPIPNPNPNPNPNPLQGDNLLVDLSPVAPGTTLGAEGGDGSQWGRLKIADFGSSRELGGSGTHSMH